MITSMFAAVLLILSTSNHELLIAACLWTCCAALLASKRQIAFHLTVSDSDSRYNMLLQRRAWASSS